MKMRFTILLFIFAIFQYQIQAQSLTIAKKNTVPFEIDGLIIFKGMINGSEANIAWDKGFSNSTVDQTFFKKNNLKELEDQAQVIDANGKNFHVNKSLLKSLQFGDTAISNLVVDVADFSQLPMKIDAILGADIINQYIWDFNFDKNEFYLSKNQIEKKQSMKSLS